MPLFYKLFFLMFLDDADTLVFLEISLVVKARKNEKKSKQS